MVGTKEGTGVLSSEQVSLTFLSTGGLVLIIREPRIEASALACIRMDSQSQLGVSSGGGVLLHHLLGVLGEEVLFPPRPHCGRGGFRWLFDDTEGRDGSIG